MVATYTVTDNVAASMSFSGTRDRLSVTWEKDYEVEVSGVAATSVTEYDVLSASGLPVVNRSIYTVNNKIIPFVICRDKKATRHQKRRSRWTVKTKWKASLESNSAETDNEPIDPPDALTDITPRVVPSLEETEVVLYEDLKTEPDQILTPTGNQWKEPAIQRIPTLTLQISQYEASLTYEEMLDRKLRVNSGTYRTKERYKWLIEQIEFTEVDVLLSGGATTAALVTYTLKHSPFEHGWKDSRLLIDTHYKESTTDVKTPFTDEYGNRTVGLVDPQGYPKLEGEDPEYVQYETYPTTNFLSFLQV